MLKNMLGWLGFEEVAETAEASAPDAVESPPAVALVKVEKDQSKPVETPDEVLQPPENVWIYKEMTTSLPEKFLAKLAHFLSGYPQYIDQAFLYVRLSVTDTTDGYFMGFTSPEGKVNADWAEMTFIPYLEDLIEAHADQCEVELNLAFLDEEPEARKVLQETIAPFYTSPRK